MDNLQKLLNTTPNDPNTAKFLAAFAFELSEPDDFDPDQYMTASADGIELILNDGIIKTIFLFAQGRDDHQAYQGNLPAALTFSSRLSEVVQTLGKPSQRSKDGAWVRYDHADYCLHLTFNQTLELVTLMTPDVAP
jgi:hypothetical protein